MAPYPSTYPSIPATFTQKKTAILTSLSAPASTYSDLSPKGTVDTAIQDLIDRLNTLEGVVTTSSCAGRVSVFLEGRKHGKGKAVGRDDGGCKEGMAERQAAVPGGKGMGGRWLFVSHEPVQVRRDEEPVSRILGLEPMEGMAWLKIDMEVDDLRLVRFQFEPMILHIMTASLHHAQPVLAAAINAGFRESGVQSLKNLDDANAFPMVAIRSSGLALESVVGVGIDKDGVDGVGDEVSVDSIVSEEGLDLLLKLANVRFSVNTERMRRFEDELFSKEARRKAVWEDGATRRARKQAEGLRKQNKLREEIKVCKGKGNLPPDTDGCNR